MGCLIAFLLTAGPRLVLLFMWAFTARVQLAFDGFVLPLLGFIFLPFTTLAYVVLFDPLSQGISGIAWFFVGFAFLLDLGALAGSYYGNRGRLGEPR